MTEKIKPPPLKGLFFGGEVPKSLRFYNIAKELEQRINDKKKPQRKLGIQKSRG